MRMVFRPIPFFTALQVLNNLFLIAWTADTMSFSDHNALLGISQNLCCTTYLAKKSRCTSQHKRAQSPNKIKMSSMSIIDPLFISATEHFYIVYLELRPYYQHLPHWVTVNIYFLNRMPKLTFNECSKKILAKNTETGHECIRFLFISMNCFFIVSGFIL